MNVYEPLNPYESDNTFQKVLQHSHEHNLNQSFGVANKPKPTELDTLTSEWKRGKMPYHEYIVKKYAVERAARGWHGYRRDFGMVDKKRTF